MNARHGMILGVRELAQPNGNGYLYFQLPPNSGEHFLCYVWLNKIAADEFSMIITQALDQIRQYACQHGLKFRYLVRHVTFNNLRPWAQKIAMDVISESLGSCEKQG